MIALSPDVQQRITSELAKLALRGPSGKVIVSFTFNVHNGKLGSYKINHQTEEEVKL